MTVIFPCPLLCDKGSQEHLLPVPRMDSWAMWLILANGRQGRSRHGNLHGKCFSLPVCHYLDNSRAPQSPQQLLSQNEASEPSCPPKCYCSRYEMENRHGEEVCYLVRTDEFIFIASTMNNHKQWFETTLMDYVIILRTEVKTQSYGANIMV